MELFEQMIHHTSVRAFEDRKLPTELKQKLVLAAQGGASSNFLQAYSIIEVRDSEKLAQIEAISNAFGYVKETGVFYLFVADLNKHAQVLKANNREADLDHLRTIESLTVAIVDATIAAQGMTVYAESQELGICYIGGIRNDLYKIAEILALPELTYPLFGLTIGYPKVKNEVKPRFQSEAVVSIDRYHPLDEQALSTYDQTMENYYASRSSNTTNANWSTKVQQHFSTNRRPEIKDFLAKQGFKL